MLVQARQGVPFGTHIRYRTAGGEWYAGETVDIRDSELKLLCDEPLELHADVDILLPSKVQVKGRELPLNLLCTGRVVGRVLANWPDLRCALVVSISGCQIWSEPGGGEANTA
ncbi:MAG: hypothetical protein LAN64_06700 [Acidobacteriia bacterium]|nr:hypothetical protein [Terriglobia bacterium]